MLAGNSRDVMGLTPDVKTSDDDVHTVQKLISCLKRRVTWRATITPKNPPSCPTRKSKTATSPSAKLKTATHCTSRMKITPAPSFEHILFTPTTPIEPTSDVCIGSPTLAIWSSTSLRPMGVWVAWGSTTTSRGTAWSPVSSGIPSLTAPDVSGYALSPMFHPFQINCSGRGLQRPYFKWKDVCNPLPLSLIDYNSRRPICGRISSPAHSALGGSSSGNWYRKAREDHIDFFITLMEDDHPVDIAEQL